MLYIHTIYLVTTLRVFALRLLSLRMHYRFINGQHSNGAMQLDVAHFGVYIWDFSIPEFWTKIIFLFFFFLLQLCHFLRRVRAAEDVLTSNTQNLIDGKFLTIFCA